jgi:hypothetical protein
MAQRRIKMSDKVTSKEDELINELNDIANTYIEKNKNYGDSFSKTNAELGTIAGLVPLYNKLNRATELIKHAGDSGFNKFESLNDTLKDLATYALMLNVDIKLHGIKIGDTIYSSFEDEKGNKSEMSYAIPNQAVVVPAVEDISPKMTCSINNENSYPVNSSTTDKYYYVKGK